MRLCTRSVAPALAVGLSLLAAGGVSAQPIPPHPADLTYDLLDFTPPVAADHRHQLSNGVVTFVVEDHELPLVSISLTIRTGYLSRSAGQDRAGESDGKSDAGRWHVDDERGRPRRGGGVSGGADREPHRRHQPVART